MHPFLNIADRAARQAGKIILDGLNRLDRIRLHKKEDNRGIVIFLVDYGTGLGFGKRGQA